MSGLLGGDDGEGEGVGVLGGTGDGERGGVGGFGRYR